MFMLLTGWEMKRTLLEITIRTLEILDLTPLQKPEISYGYKFS